MTLQRVPFALLPTPPSSRNTPEAEIMQGPIVALESFAITFFRSPIQFNVRSFLSGEFSLYDHVLDHSAQFNVIPPRYLDQNLNSLDVYFAMGRGCQADGVDLPASEMKKC